MTHEEFEGHEARLFPSAHISSTREAELRAASSLLAMVRAVSEFGRIVVRAAGGPGGRIACYTEVSFKRGDPPLKTVRPDGIIPRRPREHPMVGTGQVLIFLSNLRTVPRARLSC